MNLEGNTVAKKRAQSLEVIWKVDATCSACAVMLALQGPVPSWCHQKDKEPCEEIAAGDQGAMVRAHSGSPHCPFAGRWDHAVLTPRAG